MSRDFQLHGPTLRARLARFMGSTAVLVLVGVLVPVGLMATSESRFGGRSPLHGLAAPGNWSLGRAADVLGRQLSDRALADLVVRVALVVAWLAVVMFVATVVAEVAHMARHGGHHVPDIRGLTWSQRGARTIAAGLLALLPLLSTSQPVLGSLGPPAGPHHAHVPTVTVTDVAPDPRGVGQLSVGLLAPPTEPTLAASAERYVVRPGDSIYGIARRVTDGDDDAVAAYAERILDLNLGREMVDGERFTNPGYVDVGWVLALPATSPAASAAGDVGMHVVRTGESLWSIADAELGDATRWTELFAANQGRRFDDGMVLDQPDLIRPGWELQVPQVEPGDGESTSQRPSPSDDAPAAPAGVDVALPWVTEAASHAKETPADQHLDAPVVPDQAVEPRPPADVAPGHVAEHAVRPAPSDAPENLWVVHGGDDGAHTVTDSSSPDLLTVRRAVMLSAGALTLLAVRRRRRLRESAPSARLPEAIAQHAITERELRLGGVASDLARVDLAVRAATMALIEDGQRLLAALATPGGDIELIATGLVSLPSPWTGGGSRWTLLSSSPLEALADEARKVNAPCPTLVQLGVDEHERNVYVDLEALGALEVSGPTGHADAIVAAVAATLAGSVLAETTTLVSAGVPVDAFLGHRLHTAVVDGETAIVVAREAVGALPTLDDPPFELRARGTCGEGWDPAVVLIGSGARPLAVPFTEPMVAVVSAAPLANATARLVPDGDGWRLLPVGVRLHPVGLVPDDVSAISSLLDVRPAEPIRPTRPVEFDEDRTIYADDELVPIDEPGDESADIDATATPLPPRSSLGWDLLVRLFGPVDVVDRDGNRVVFERSKTTELVAWLATHRERATRSNARTALWEQDVRDATFANVVSEARRALARLVEPPAGSEWLGRTLTDALPLHPRVVTDADLLQQAVACWHRERSPQALAVLRDGVERIAGLPFEGTSYLWPDAEGLTSNLVLLAMSATAELAAQCLDTGDVHGVFDATGRGLRVLPGHEELIGLRMKAHARAGDHAGVRHEWNSYERVVNADPWSDGEPSPKLVGLRKELLQPGV